MYNIENAKLVIAENDRYSFSWTQEAPDKWVERFCAKDSVLGWQPVHKCEFLTTKQTIFFSKRLEKKGLKLIIVIE